VRKGSAERTEKKKECVRAVEKGNVTGKGENGKIKEEIPRGLVPHTKRKKSKFERGRALGN